MLNEREITFALWVGNFVLVTKETGPAGERGDPNDPALQDRTLRQSLAAAAAHYGMREGELRTLFFRGCDLYERELDRISPSSGAILEFERQPFDFGKVFELVRRSWPS